MKLDKNYKENLFKKFGKNKNVKDTGSSESQIALFEYRIKYLTEHLKLNKKDHSTKLSLIKIVNKKRKLLSYLKSNNIERYNLLLDCLSLKKK